MERQWLVQGLLNGGKLLGDTSEPCSTVESLKTVLNSNPDTIAVFETAILRTPNWEAYQDVIASYTGDLDLFLIVVPWRRPPLHARSVDEKDVCSFCISTDIFRSVWNQLTDDRKCLPGLCYEILSHIAADTSLGVAVQVWQCGSRSAPVNTDEIGQSGCSMVVAHRGPLNHLATSLLHVNRFRQQLRRCLIGLDLSDVAEYDQLVSARPKDEVYQFAPAPVGPYVVRKRLIDLCDDPFILFHDSDDISCRNRLSALSSGFDSPDVGLVGSHELRLDELEHRVVAIRYPLDASAALMVWQGVPQLHPTTLIRRSVLESAGGFSTHSHFGNDLQLLLRLYFHTTIRNVDEFLYIRRRHLGALTVQSTTGIGSPARLKLEAAWLYAFEAIKRGSLRIEESSLRATHTTLNTTLRRLQSPGNS